MRSALFNWTFDSFSFLFFLIPVFLLYWGCIFLPRAKVGQNLVLMLSGILFYAVLQVKYLFLLAGSGLLAFYLVPLLQHPKGIRWRKGLAAAGIVLHVGVLLFFKYVYAISETVQQWLRAISIPVDWHFPMWVLPLGISFFTFQLIAYWIDVYQENIEPERDLIGFMAYLFFFPKLLSGPIARVQHLMPQLHEARVFDADLASEGLRQWAWGLFKKLLISNVAGVYIQQVFHEGTLQYGGDLWLAACLFPFQIYADFSGYTDMALGISKLFGIRLNSNFNYPFFATNIKDYWQRWHISLTGWMMDYVYTPCSFALRRSGKRGVFISILITFVLVGVWHGANWTYILYGMAHSIYFIPAIYITTGSSFPALPVWIRRILLYSLVSFTSVIMLSESVGQALHNYWVMFTSPHFFEPRGELMTWTFILPAVSLMVFDWFSREAEFPLHHDVIKNKWIRRGIVALILMVIFYNQHEQLEFMYFQF